MTWEFIAAAFCLVVFSGIVGRLFSKSAVRASSARPSAGGLALARPTAPLCPVDPAASTAAAGTALPARRTMARKVRPATRLAGRPRGAAQLVSTAPRGLKVLRVLRTV